MELGRGAARVLAQLLDRHDRWRRRPAAAPVWGVRSDGALYFGTNPQSLKGRNVAATRAW